MTSAALVPAAPAVVTPTAPLPCGATAGLALPAGWPAEVPLPAGRLVTYGRVPGEFHETVRFLAARLPAAGFTQRDSQVVRRDAESDSSAGLHGRWSVALAGSPPFADRRIVCRYLH